ncbi:MAG TPA: alpha-E domain-containing protein [Anaeromyxobacteraceae bacterium]|nr:alpha-E domain-containing protein [Anaeromyxobacteraceae bacterium]
MISRVADQCFWLGRYLERAESSARVLGVTRNLALDAGVNPRHAWLPVIIVSGEEERFLARFGAGAADEGERVQEYLTWDEENPCSIRRSLAAARDNARSIREVVSLEAWEALNALHLWVLSPRARAEWRDDRHSFYRRIRTSAQSLQGIVRGTMLHDDALHFIFLGVMLERAGQTSRILDVHHHAFRSIDAHDVIETALWLSLLRACSGFEPFMKLHRGRVSPDAVARFLVLEPLFPRSVRFSLRAAASRLERIRPPEEPALAGRESYERLRALAAWVGSKQRDFDTAGLHDLLTRVVDETSAIAGVLGRELFGQVPEVATGAQAQ